MAAQLRDRENNTETQGAGQGEQYLTFNVSDEVFAININIIREIIEYRAPTIVPMMPAHIRGVINLRGRVVPVIDLSARFGRDATVASRRTCIVILEITQDDVMYYIGIVVDAVKSVQDIAHDDIEPPPTFGANLRSDFIKGMGKIDDKFIIILDVDHVLSIEELSMLSEMENTGDSRTSANIGSPKNTQKTGDVKNSTDVDDQADDEE